MRAILAWMIGLFLFICIPCLSKASQAATTREVCKSGCVGYSTIQSAVDQSLVGDTVLVHEGTYAENLRIYNTITVKSVNGATSTTIDGQGMGTVVTMISNANGVLDGFTITNGYSSTSMAAGIDTSNSPTITNCIISRNSGPGILSQQGSPVITNCAITDNLETGISIAGGAPLVSNCTISGNTSSTTAGGIRTLNSSAKISKCTISGNHATGSGGGVWLDGGTISNCIISNNTTDWSGGGIEILGASYIYNCTITGNTAQIGGGINRNTDPYVSGTPVIKNSIVYNNTSTMPSEPYEVHGPVDVYYSDIKSWAHVTGSNNIAADPQFIGAGNYHLQSTSPCINTGTNLGSLGVIDDFDGIRRPQGPYYDIGAFEYLVQSSNITISKSLYDYVLDKLEVNATSPNGANETLELAGYGNMTWDSKLRLWKKTVASVLQAPLTITVCGPINGCKTIY